MLQFTIYFLLKYKVVKDDMEERLKGWKEEQEEFSQLFRTLCLCRKKTLLKGNQEIVELVAKKQLTLLKRVNINAAKHNILIFNFIGT